MPILDHWKRTGAPVERIDGHEFVAYRVGINRYVRHCEAIDATIHNWLSYYTATVGESVVLSPRTGKAHRFRERGGAYKAAISKALAA